MSTMTNERAGCGCRQEKSLPLLFDCNGQYAYIDPKKSIVAVIDHGYELTNFHIEYCPMCGRPFNLRPMALEEAVAYGGPVWCEVREGTPGIDVHAIGISLWGNPDIVSQLVETPDMRYWAWKPTPEQSAAWKWEEEE